MLTEKRIDELTCKLTDDFDKNENGKLRSDFAGAYVKDNDLHIILVDNADVEYYKSVLNDDSVKYHYTDVSYAQLFDTRNMLRDVYSQYGIYMAAINDEKSQIQLTILDVSSSDGIKSYLRLKGVPNSFIDKHIVFIEDKDILNHIPQMNEDEFCEIMDDEVSANEKESKADITVYPGQKVWGLWYNTTTGKYNTNIATIGFDALRGSDVGFVTAWHFAYNKSKMFLHAVTSSADNSYIGTNNNGLFAEGHDTAFIIFDSGDGSTIKKSRKIMNTEKSLTHVASISTITSLPGKTLHLYGAVTSSTGTVVSTSVDYEMRYTLSDGTYTTTRVYDTIDVSGASQVGGDSGGPITYEVGSNVTLVGILSGISNDKLHTFVNKITNITEGMRVTVTG